MPMNWDAAADAKLFAGVLATSEVKIKYAELAAFMGTDCTAKAITHRIAIIKKLAAGLNTNAPFTTTTATTPPATPRKRKGKNVNGDAPASKKRSTAEPKAKKGAPAHDYGSSAPEEDENEDGSDEVNSGEENGDGSDEA